MSIASVTLCAPCGPVSGQKNQNILQFLGIPYAQPPVGKLRFLPPQPVEPWNTPVDCTQQPPMLPQGPSDLDKPMGPLNLPQSEGALSVCVWAPAQQKNLPVAVWLHGGANFCGAGCAPWYQGHFLALQEKIVVVTVNYRLGALGFLHALGLNEENLAIADQIAALGWVKTNIAAFGGDPQRITVFGQSAGANSIVHMMGLSAADGLFQQAYLMSPSLGRGNFTTAQAHDVAAHLLPALGCNLANTASLRSTVQGKTVAEILQATEKAFREIGKKYGGMLFRPVNDQWAEPEAAIDAAVHGAKHKNLRIIIGTVQDETFAFSEQRDPASVERLREIQRARFDGPALAFADAAAQAGVPVRKYRFTWSASCSLYGSCHCIDLPFLFGTYASWQAPMLKGLTSHEAQFLTNSLQHAFGAFVRGDAALISQWPLYSTKEPIHRLFSGADVRNALLPRSDFGL